MKSTSDSSNRRSGFTDEELKQQKQLLETIAHESMDNAQYELNKKDQNKTIKNTAMVAVLLAIIVVLFAKYGNKLQEEYYFRIDNKSFSISYSDKQEVDDKINEYQEMFKKIKGDNNSSQFFEESKGQIKDILFAAANESEISFRQSVLALAKFLGNGNYSEPLDQILKELAFEHGDEYTSTELLSSGSADNYYGHIGAINANDYWLSERKRIYYLYLAEQAAKTVKSEDRGVK